MQIDEIDKAILNALQRDGQTTISELGKLVDLSSSGIQKRLKKLEDQNFIDSYTAILNRKRLNLTLLCFIEVSLRTHSRTDVADFDRVIHDLPEVLECHRLTGGADYLLKVVAYDRESLDNFLMDTLMPIPAIDKVKTSIVLKEIKETTVVPVGR